MDSKYHFIRISEMKCEHYLDDEMRHRCANPAEIVMMSPDYGEGRHYLFYCHSCGMTVQQEMIVDFPNMIESVVE